MLVTGEQFNIMCSRCLFLVVLTKNLKELERHCPSWDEKSVFVDCFQGNCPMTLLSQDGDESTWKLMTGIYKPFDRWWQEMLEAYDKRAKQGLAPKRPVKENNTGK